MKLLSVLCVLSLSGSVLPLRLLAQEATETAAKKEKPQPLKPGSPAPALSGGNFLRGETVKEFEKDKLYIIDFWATWSGPSEVTLAHVSRLQEKFKDQGVIVIGQNVYEQTDEDYRTFFLDGLGDKLKCRIAADMPEEGSRGYMVSKWLEPAGFTTIPATIVVGKDGRIAWVGHPSRLTEETVTQLLAGTFDQVKFEAETARLKQEDDTLRQALAPLMPRLQKALDAKDWTTAAALADEMEKALPEARRESLHLLRLDIALGCGDGPATVKHAVALAGSPEAGALLLNSIAWRIATTDGLKDLDYEPVEKIARDGLARASAEEKGMIGDTVARVLWLRGKKEEAVRMQEEAVDAASEGMRASLERTLESYRRGELPDASPAD